MPVITIKDPTLLERLKRIKPQPAEDSFDDVLYELLRRVERAESKPRLSGLEDLPRLVVEEVRKALDGQLLEAVKSALLPNLTNLTIEIPVELNVKVRLRLEPVLDVSPLTTGSSNNSEVTTGSVAKRSKELDELEQRAIELLRERGGCWEGSAYSLVKFITGGDIDWALEKRLRRRLVKRDGRLCLPEAVAQA